MLKEFDVVTLIKDREDLGLKAGNVGTIVMAHGAPDAFEVEFLRDNGSMLILETFSSHELRPVKKSQAIPQS